MRSSEEWEEIIDALEYRVAQLEERVYRESNPTDLRNMQKRRQIYYRVMNRATDHA